MLVRKIVKLLNDHFPHLAFDFSERDILMASRFGKKIPDKPRPVKAVLNSDWAKKDIMKHKWTLQGTDVYLK